MKRKMIQSLICGAIGVIAVIGVLRGHETDAFFMVLIPIVFALPGLLSKESSKRPLSLYMEGEEVVLFVPDMALEHTTGSRIRYSVDKKYRFDPDDVEITFSDHDVFIEGYGTEAIYHCENISKEGVLQYRQPAEVSLLFGNNQITVSGDIKDMYAKK